MRRQLSKRSPSWTASSHEFGRGLARQRAVALCSAMSRRSDTVAAETCVALGATDARVESYPNRELRLGSLAISRALPVKQRRLVGPWCFLDRFGPLTFSKGKPMDVAPHPHIGLQTVTWLLQGEVVHDDSLGYESILRPGGVNVMTSGNAIAHAEQTPGDNSGQLNGVQLWVALPDSHRHMPASFEHIEQVPAIESPAGRVQVFAGALQGETSPACTLLCNPWSGCACARWTHADTAASRGFRTCRAGLER